MPSEFMLKLAGELQKVGPPSKMMQGGKDMRSGPITLREFGERATVKGRKWPKRRKSDTAFTQPKTMPVSQHEALIKRSEFRNAFIDELDKLADEDKTEKAVKRGAKIGAVGGGVINFIRGLIAGATAPSRPALSVTRDNVTPDYTVPKGVRMGIYGAGKGLRGAVKGALLGGAVGFLRRKKGTKGAKEQK